MRIEVMEVSQGNTFIKSSDADYGLVWVSIWDLFPNRNTDLPWLSGIEEYGTTFFNDTQLVNVLAELDKVKLGINDKKIVKEIDKTIEFIKSKSKFSLIKFLGD